VRFTTQSSWRQSSPRRAHANSDALDIPGLCFHDPPGPLLAVAGLSGGAGASVLAYLIAATAARHSTGPVLVADTGGPTGGLAAHAAVSAPRTLVEIAERIDHAEPVTGCLWAQGENGLRVLAGSPQFTVDATRESIQRVLHDARHAHALTVLDAGTLARPAEQTALATATHVAWALQGTRDGAARARRVLERIVPLTCPEIIVARAHTGRGGPPMRELADLADERRAPLVLIPSLEHTAGGRLGELAEAGQVALQAIGGVLGR
jgi:hypothetical protein